MVLDFAAKLVVGALLAQFLLPLLILLKLGKVRKADYKIMRSEGKSKEIQRLGLDSSGWSDAVLQVQNCYKNQFELPVIFIAMAVLALALQQADYIFSTLCILFVASRYAHAYVHTTTNHIPLRLGLFLVGMLIVFIQLLYLGTKILGV